MAREDKLVDLIKQRASLEGELHKAEFYLTLTRAKKATEQAKSGMASKILGVMQSIDKRIKNEMEAPESARNVIEKCKDGLDTQMALRAGKDVILATGIETNRESIRRLETEAMGLKKEKNESKKTPDYALRKLALKNLIAVRITADDDKKSEIDAQIQEIYAQEPVLKCETRLSEIKTVKKDLRSSIKTAEMERVKNRAEQVADRASVVKDVSVGLVKLSPFQKFLAPIIGRFGIDKKIANLTTSFEDNIAQPLEVRTQALANEVAKAEMSRIQTEAQIENTERDMSQNLKDKKEAVVETARGVRDVAVGVGSTIGTATVSVGQIAVGMGASVGDATKRLLDPKNIKGFFDKMQARGRLVLEKNKTENVQQFQQMGEDESQTREDESQTREDSDEERQ